MGQRRKYVLQTAFNQNVQPPADNQQIVRAVGARGGNIIEVEYPSGSTTLCMMPARFNRKLWVRRGGFLIIEPSPEAEEDENSRVTGTISAVLYDEHIKQLKKMPGVWPPEFSIAIQSSAVAPTADDLMPSSDTEDDEHESADEARTGATADGALQVQGSNTQQQQQQQQGQQQQQQQQSGQDLRTPLCPADAGEAVANGVSTSVQGQSTSLHRGVQSDDDSSEDDDDLPPLQQIHNRRVVQYELSDDSESDE